MRNGWDIPLIASDALAEGHVVPLDTESPEIGSDAHLLQQMLAPAVWTSIAGVE